MQASAPRRLPSGFSLVELLTVIAVVGILAAILIPVVGKVRASARQTQSLSNLRQIALMFPGYAAENKGRMPWFSVGGTPPAADSPTVWHEFLKDYSGKANYESVYACAEWKARVTSTGGSNMGFGVSTIAPIGGNMVTVNIGTYQADGSIKPNTGVRRMNLNTVERPPQTILLGSAGRIVGDGTGRTNWNLSFNPSFADAGRWLQEDRVGALRHNGKAAYAFYDYSVQVLDPDTAFRILKGN